MTFTPSLFFSCPFTGTILVYYFPSLLGVRCLMFGHEHALYTPTLFPFWLYLNQGNPHRKNREGKTKEPPVLEPPTSGQPPPWRQAVTALRHKHDARPPYSCRPTTHPYIICNATWPAPCSVHVLWRFLCWHLRREATSTRQVG